MKKWICVCGFVHDGDSAPESCPYCSSTAEDFRPLDDAAAALVESSRVTNTLLCRLVELGRRMEATCKEGLGDDLDPTCSAVFEKSLYKSYEIMKLAMTEMKSHASKGKWC